MKNKLIHIILFNALMGISYSHAIEKLELRCTYHVSVKETEQTEYYDKLGNQIRVSELKNNTISENGIDYVKIEITNKNTFKIEIGDHVYSTNPNENKFGTWNNEEITLSINGQMKENEIFVIAKMSTNKYSNLNTLRRIKIDRVSGDYEYLIKGNAIYGEPKKDEAYHLRILNNDSVSKGNCEKFIRKF